MNCPRCGSPGLEVGAETLDARLAPAVRTKIADAGFFCSLRCEVVYFDRFERVVLVGEIERPIWPKDVEAPLCSCFGLTRDDIEADISEQGVTRVKQLVAQAKSPEARCVTLAPSGHSCVAEVQRYFMKRRRDQLLSRQDRTFHRPGLASLGP